MAGLPHPLLQDSVHVSKPVGRSRLAIWFQDEAELLQYDMTSANRIMVGDYAYAKDNSFVGAVSGAVILDGNGNRWRKIVGTDIFLPFSMSLGIGPNELIFGHQFVVPVSFPENMVGSSARALSTATSTRELPFKKNGTQFGKVIYTTALPLATFESDPISFAPGDYFTLYGPPGLDATLGNLFGTFLGSR